MSDRAKARLRRALLWRAILDDAWTGNPSPLVDLIRKDVRFDLFGDGERESLANLLETKLQKPKRGRPALHPENPKTEFDCRKRTLDECVAYVRWARSVCKECGLSYRNRGDELIKIVLAWRIKNNMTVATLEQVRTALRG
jgi:hypothetical protein